MEGRGKKSDRAAEDLSGNGSARYFINIGERDGYDWMSLKDFLKASLGLGKEDVYKVDVKGSFSFFNTDTELMGLVLETFADFRLKGRSINVEVSNKPGGGKRKAKGKGRRRKNESSGFKSNPKRSGKKRNKKRRGYY